MVKIDDLSRVEEGKGKDFCCSAARAAGHCCSPEKPWQQVAAVKQHSTVAANAVMSAVCNIMVLLL